MREMILTGVLEMGSRLNEIDLSEAFWISRRPLREAITRCTANDLGQIERILDSAEDAISRGESSAYPKALDFHQEELMTQHLRRSLANALRVSVIEGAPNSGATPVRDDERPGRTTT